MEEVKESTLPRGSEAQASEPLVSELLQIRRDKLTELSGRDVRRHQECL